MKGAQVRIQSMNGKVYAGITEEQDAIKKIKEYRVETP